eukprot:COSAG04_NODE_30045_length_265_cov_0.620482_1_plen_21_part_01
MQHKTLVHSPYLQLYTGAQTP